MFMAFEDKFGRVQHIRADKIHHITEESKPDRVGHGSAVMEHQLTVWVEGFERPLSFLFSSEESLARVGNLLRMASVVPEKCEG